MSKTTTPQNVTCEDAMRAFRNLAGVILRNLPSTLSPREIAEIANSAEAVRISLKSALNPVNLRRISRTLEIGHEAFGLWRTVDVGYDGMSYGALADSAKFGAHTTIGPKLTERYGSMYSSTTVLSLSERIQPLALVQVRYLMTQEELEQEGEGLFYSEVIERAKDLGLGMVSEQVGLRLLHQLHPALFMSEFYLAIEPLLLGENKIPHTIGIHFDKEYKLHLEAYPVKPFYSGKSLVFALEKGNHS